MAMVLTSCSFAMAQQPGIVTDNSEGWQKIGETTVSFRGEDESIVVFGADEFEALKLRVTDGSIIIDRLQVFYESGETQELDPKANLKEGAETQAYPLKHSGRDIQKVAFTYRSAANDSGDKAHVELHGWKSGNQGESDAYRQEGTEKQGTVDSAGGGANQAMDRNEAEGDSTMQEAEKAATEAGQELNDHPENIEDDIEEGGDRIKADIEQNTDSLDNEVSEAAANTAAGIADELVKDKVAPAGQQVYRDKEKRYYYINNEGDKVFLERNQLKNKVD